MTIPNGTRLPARRAIDRGQAICARIGVAVSEATYFRTRSVQDYETQRVPLKGIGEVDIYGTRFGE